MATSSTSLTSSASLTSLTSAAIPKEFETIPLKREFIDPVARYQSLANSNVSDVKVIEGVPKWDMLTVDKKPVFDWYFAPNDESHNIIVAAVTTDAAYELGDNFLQYFTESEIFNIKKRKYPSVVEFYLKNFPLIYSKAMDLKKSDPITGMPDRFYINEVLYKIPEIKRVKPMRISTALAIFRYFDSKVVFDPNPEFWGRMIAASISGATVYHCLNPKGYNFAYEIQNFLNKPNFYVAEAGLDILVPNVVEQNSYDTVFTQLSFFEDDEENKRLYQTEYNWLKQYAYNFISNSVKALVKNGYLMLYFSDHRYTKYMRPISEYCVCILNMTFLGVIGVTKTDLDFANAILVWRK